MRKPREWYPGAVYHIMNRGNRRGDLFREEEDYVRYLKILAIARGRFPFRLLGYCLMTNHVHLLIETLEDPHWRIIQYAHRSYCVYFNKKYNLIGHLFQGRYTDEIVEEDSYELEVSRYIHLNPVRANMVERPADYPWSSYGLYAGQVEETVIPVAAERILGHFEGDRRAEYCKFVEGGVPCRP